MLRNASENIKFAQKIAVFRVAATFSMDRTQSNALVSGPLPAILSALSIPSGDCLNGRMARD
jgi:hypothetical protein